MPTSSVLRSSSILLALCAASLAPMALAQEPSTLDIMPLPAHSATMAGSLTLDRGMQVVFEGYTEPRLDRARRRFLDILSRQTGVAVLPANPAGQSRLTIRTAGPSEPVQRLGEVESYRLDVSSTGATLTAPNPLGVLHGLQTLLQLVQSTPQGFAIYAVTIDDKPRFPWRGLMLDSGRHFMPLDMVHRTLDGMEAVKLNVFHWHLSENQGFRVESKTYPLLQEKGSDGLYYTQEDVKGIIDYARDRGIRVIPEFDMPGHATAWFAGYPQLASGPGPYQIERKWGIFDPAMDPTRESTYVFLDQFIAEMTSLFPDAYFHIGGDECNGKEWDANPRIQQYMRAHNIAGNAALQAYFTGRVQQLVTRHHKIAVGWDEVLQPNTPKDVVIQSWRGQKSLSEAAARGFHGILSAGYYIDLNQSAAQHYSVDPLVYDGTHMPAAIAANILGGEATMWTEFVTPENVDSRIWPRTAAIAERLWSPQDVTDTQSMYKRADLLSAKLAYYNLPFRAVSAQMLQRLGAHAAFPSLQVLASVVQPPEGYAREQLRPYDAFTPLNRLVDAVPPESDGARRFNELAALITKGGTGAEAMQQARTSLLLWRDNDAQLRPSLAASPLTVELIPLSHNLSQAAEIGLAALDALEHNTPVSLASRSRQLATLKTLKAPQAVLLNMIVPGVELLVRSTKPD